MKIAPSRRCEISFKPSNATASPSFRTSAESAIPLSPDTQGRIEAGLSRAYGPGLSFSFAESPSLIGGMRIKVGSDVFDGSVRNRLESLEESF